MAWSTLSYIELKVVIKQKTGYFYIWNPNPLSGENPLTEVHQSQNNLEAINDFQNMESIVGLGCFKDLVLMYLFFIQWVRIESTWSKKIEALLTLADLVNSDDG